MIPKKKREVPSLNPNDAHYAGTNKTLEWQGEKWISVQFGSRGLHKWIRQNDPKAATYQKKQQQKSRVSPVKSSASSGSDDSPQISQLKSTPLLGTRKLEMPRREFRPATGRHVGFLYLLRGPEILEMRPEMLEAPPTAQFTVIKLTPEMYDFMRSGSVDARTRSNIIRKRGPDLLEISPKEHPFVEYQKIDLPPLPVDGPKMYTPRLNQMTFLLDYIEWINRGAAKFAKKLNPKQRFQELLFYRHLNPRYFYVHPKDPKQPMLGNDGLMFRLPPKKTTTHLGSSGISREQS